MTVLQIRIFTLVLPTPSGKYYCSTRESSLLKKKEKATKSQLQSQILQKNQSHEKWEPFAFLLSISFELLKTNKQTVTIPNSPEVFHTLKNLYLFTGFLDLISIGFSFFFQKS